MGPSRLQSGGTNVKVSTASLQGSPQRTHYISDHVMYLQVACTDNNISSELQSTSIDGDSQSRQLIPANGFQKRFIHDPEHRHNVLVLVLADELDNISDVVHRPLRVRHAHVPVEKVNSAQTARIVESVLRARNCMQFEEDAQTVLARPLEGKQNVVPGRFGEERLARPCLDCPVGNWEADPVEARARDLGEVLFSLQCMKMSKREKGGGA